MNLADDKKRIIMFPFNAVDDADGKPDRSYDAEDFAADRALFYTDGVYPNPSDNLKILSLTGNMVVTVRPGAGFIKGHNYIQKDEAYVRLDDSHPTYDRKDIIVLRLDETGREILVINKTGVPSSNPTAPGLQRDADVWELKLAEILIPKGTSQILSGNVLDTRLDTGVCGVVVAALKEVDTADLFNQYHAFYTEHRALWECQSEEWTAYQRDYQAQRIAELDGQYINFANLLGALETQSFTLINNNFDDWSVRRGCRFVTEFLQDGAIRETITVITPGITLAERLTEFTDGGGIVTTVTFYPWETSEGGTVLTTAYTASRRAVFEGNKVIEVVL